jgi:hypothetical protein
LQINSSLHQAHDETYDDIHHFFIELKQLIDALNIKAFVLSRKFRQAGVNLLIFI